MDVACFQEIVCNNIEFSIDCKVDEVIAKKDADENIVKYI